MSIVCDICLQGPDLWMTPDWKVHPRNFRLGSDGLWVCSECDYFEYGLFLEPHHYEFLDQLSERILVGRDGCVTMRELEMVGAFDHFARLKGRAI